MYGSVAAAAITKI